MGTSDGVPYPMEDRMADLEDRQRSDRRWLIVAWVLLALACIGTGLSFRVAVVANRKANELRDSLSVAKNESAFWRGSFATMSETTLVVRERLADQGRSIAALQATARHQAGRINLAESVQADMDELRSDLTKQLNGEVWTMAGAQRAFRREQADSLAAFREWMALQRDEMEQKYSQTFVRLNDELTVQQLELGRVKRKLNIMLPLGLVNLVWTGVHTSGDSHHRR